MPRFYHRSLLLLLYILAILGNESSDASNSSFPVYSEPFPAFYFYLKAFQSPQKAYYQHPIVALGEGLCDLKQNYRVQFLAIDSNEPQECWWPSNVNYWPNEPNKVQRRYLFRRKQLKDVATAVSVSQSVLAKGAGNDAMAHVIIVASALVDIRILPQILLAPMKRRAERYRIIPIKDLDIPPTMESNQNVFSRDSSNSVKISTVFVDWRDGVYFNQLAGVSFDLYFKAHYASYIDNFNVTGNVRVGSFYMTNRILNAAEVARRKVAEAEDRSRVSTKVILFPHGAARLRLDVRSLAWKEFYSTAAFGEGFVATDHDDFDRRGVGITEESAYIWWELTGHRHNPSFYTRLAAHRACDCSGGYFYDRKTSETITGTALTMTELSGETDNGVVVTSWSRSIGILQWESFKLWESFATGCVVIMPDLEHFGLALPVMPNAWEHYLPIRFDNRSSLQQLRERLLTMTEVEFKEIGERGRTWALKNYAPISLVRYLALELDLEHLLQ